MITRYRTHKLYVVVAERPWLGPQGQTTYLATYTERPRKDLVPADYDEPGGRVRHKIVVWNISVRAEEQAAEEEGQ